MYVCVFMPQLNGMLKLIFSTQYCGIFVSNGISADVETICVFKLLQNVQNLHRNELAKYFIVNI